MAKTYEIFEGQALEIAELIQQRRLQLLVHSCIYYELDRNIISDMKWDKWAKELVALQLDYPEIAKKVDWYEAFKDWDGSTGAFLPIKDPWVVAKARKVAGIRTVRVKKPDIAPVKKPSGSLSLF